MKAFSILPALAALAAAGALSGPEGAEARASGVTCEIRLTQSGGLTALTGIVHASEATSGTYRFLVSQSGAAGSSDITQAGDFSLAAGQSEVVAETTLGGRAGFSARLALSTGAGTTSCKP